MAQKQAEEALRKAEEAAARQKNAEEAAIRLNQKLVEFVAVAAETKPLSAVQSSVLSTQHTSTDRELTEKLTQELNEAKAQLKKLRRAVFDADEKALRLVDANALRGGSAFHQLVGCRLRDGKP